jgi:hypothetical protein
VVPQLNQWAPTNSRTKGRATVTPLEDRVDMAALATVDGDGVQRLLQQQRNVLARLLAVSSTSNGAGDGSMPAGGDTLLLQDQLAEAQAEVEELTASFRSASVAALQASREATGLRRSVAEKEAEIAALHRLLLLNAQRAHIVPLMPPTLVNAWPAHDTALSSALAAQNGARAAKGANDASAMLLEAAVRAVGTTLRHCGAWAVLALLLLGTHQLAGAGALLAADGARSTPASTPAVAAALSRALEREWSLAHAQRWAAGVAAQPATRSFTVPQLAAEGWAWRLALPLLLAVVFGVTTSPRGARHSRAGQWLVAYAAATAAICAAVLCGGHSGHHQGSCWNPADAAVAELALLPWVIAAAAAAAAVLVRARAAMALLLRGPAAPAAALTQLQLATLAQREYAGAGGWEDGAAGAASAAAVGGSAIGFVLATMRTVAAAATGVYAVVTPALLFGANPVTLPAVTCVLDGAGGEGCWGNLETTLLLWLPAALGVCWAGRAVAGAARAHEAARAAEADHAAFTLAMARLPPIGSDAAASSAGLAMGELSSPEPTAADRAAVSRWLSSCRAHWAGVRDEHLAWLLRTMLGAAVLAAAVTVGGLREGDGATRPTASAALLATLASLTAPLIWLLAMSAAAVARLVAAGI